MISRFTFLPLALAAMFAIGCSKSDQPTQAPDSPTNAPGLNSSNVPSPSVSDSPASGSDANLIRQAVEDHVRNDQGINMSAIDMTVDSVSVNGDQAQAKVTFRVKQGGTGMAMIYTLQRHGSGWLVISSQPGDGQFVHPPMDKTHSGTSANPATPVMPDVHDFLKSHPTPTKN